MRRSGDLPNLSGGMTPDWLRYRAGASPYGLALVAGPERLTFGELDRQASRTARQLAGMGVGAGTRVAMALRNGVPFAVLTHALARLGAVMVPLNLRLAPPEIGWQLADSRAGVLVHDDALAGFIEECARGAPGVKIVSLAALAAAAQRDVPLRENIDLSALQGIMYTSATTGRPKGAMLSYGNHWWNAVGSALNMGLHRDDRWLAPLPLYHVGGLAILWRSVIYGITAVVHETFDPDAVNRDIDGGVTIVSVVSTMLRRMLDARGGRPYPPSLRCVLLGGGPAPPGLLEECVRLSVPVAATYGLTEAASQVATLLPHEMARKMGSAGRPLLTSEVRIARVGSHDALGPEAGAEPAADRERLQAGDVEPAQPGEIGEILVRGPTVMLGYADRPEETARALRGGWLHTGDLGMLDAEGYLFVTDRRDDLIVSGGENVYPAEVEAVLAAHPAVEDAGVVGLPDPEWGQVVAAAVKVRPGARTGEEDLRTFCAQRLAWFKVPRRIWFVEAFPRSPGGKLIRREIRSTAPRYPAPEPPASSDPETP